MSLMLPGGKQLKRLVKSAVQRLDTHASPDEKSQSVIKRPFVI
jgi:hypothetical protein